MAAAVGALVVAPLLVHRAGVPVALARRRELGETVWAGVGALSRLSLSQQHDDSVSDSGGGG